MKTMNIVEVGDIKVLRKEVSNHTTLFEKGDKVEIIGTGERGYDLKELSSGKILRECGWDIFEDIEVDREQYFPKGKINLTYEEKIELSYLYLKGFRYLVRNEIGSVYVFVNKPHRDKETNYHPYGKDYNGYDKWIETKTPISLEERKRTRAVELGKYDFIKWEDEPMLIKDLIS